MRFLCVFPQSFLNRNIFSRYNSVLSWTEVSPDTSTEPRPVSQEDRFVARLKGSHLGIESRSSPTPSSGGHPVGPRTWVWAVDTALVSGPWACGERERLHCLLPARGAPVGRHLLGTQEDSLQIHSRGGALERPEDTQTATAQCQRDLWECLGVEVCVLRDTHWGEFLRENRGCHFL